MPYTKKQQKLVHAVAHGMKPRKGGMTQAAAKKMEKEIPTKKKTRAPARKR